MDRGVYALKREDGATSLEHLKPLAQFGDKTAQMLVVDCSEVCSVDNSSKYGLYAETNMVRSLVMYDWDKELDIRESKIVLDKIVKEIGSPPDIATVIDGQIGKDYQYDYFVKRNVIEKKEWMSLGYLWKRSEVAISEFAIDLSVSPRKFKCLEIHIDHSAVDNIDRVIANLVSIITAGIQPIYGIGYDMPYYWGPRAFAQGSSSSRYAASDKSIYGPPERMREQSFAFGPTFRAAPPKRGLDTCLRDVFEINFISKGHLARWVGSVTLEEFIVENKLGSLKQLTPVTWVWGMPTSDIARVRKFLVDAGLTIVK